MKYILPTHFQKVSQERDMNEKEDNTKFYTLQIDNATKNNKTRPWIIFLGRRRGSRKGAGARKEVREKDGGLGKERGEKGERSIEGKCGG